MTHFSSEYKEKLLDTHATMKKARCDFVKGFEYLDKYYSLWNNSDQNSLMTLLFWAINNFIGLIRAIIRQYIIILLFITYIITSFLIYPYF